MTITSPAIYKRDKTGRIRTWQYAVEGNCFWVITSILNQPSSVVTSKPKLCKGKQKRTHEEQAVFEAEAARTLQLRIDYHETLSDAQTWGPKVFRPMLAESFNEKRHDWSEGFSQRKLDGIRSIFHTNRYQALTRSYSREGMLQNTIPWVGAQLGQFLGRFNAFDGELYNHDFKDNLPKISGIVRKTDVTPEAIKFVKDHIQYHVYDAAIPKLTFEQRMDALTDLFANNRFDGIVLVPTDRYQTKEERVSLYGDYLADGYEGQMLRVGDSFYEEDTRSHALIKVKNFLSKEFPIIELIEGEGNWAGAVGKVVVRLPDGNPCETGLRGDYPTRAKMLQEKDEYVDGTATVRFLGYTPYGMLDKGVSIDIVKGMRTD